MRHNRAERFYNDPGDPLWLRDTALRGVQDAPDFASFILTGNEDSPETIDLYQSPDPRVDDPGLARYELSAEPDPDTGQYTYTRVAPRPPGDRARLPVVFRTWRARFGGDVLALFPTLPHDVTGRYCVSYEHIGQHGGADYLGCLGRTRPATEAEYTPLLHELHTIGYGRLRIMRRYMRPRS